MESAERDFKAKVIIIGSHGCGKTALIERFTKNEFLPRHVSTVGMDVKFHSLIIGGKRLTLSIWDTVGQEKFESINSSYYRGAQGVIFTYQIINKKRSFDRVQWWLGRYNLNEEVSQDGVEMMLVGCKCDLEERREVKTEEGKALAKKLGMNFMETSAKDNINVEEMFTQLAENIFKKMQIKPPRPRNLTIGHQDLKKKAEERNECCC